MGRSSICPTLRTAMHSDRQCSALQAWRQLCFPGVLKHCVPQCSISEDWDLHHSGGDKDPATERLNCGSFRTRGPHLCDAAGVCHNHVAKERLRLDCPLCPKFILRRLSPGASVPKSQRAFCMGTLDCLSQAEAVKGRWLLRALGEVHADSWQHSPREPKLVPTFLYGYPDLPKALN